MAKKRGGKRHMRFSTGLSLCGMAVGLAIGLVAYASHSGITHGLLASLTAWLSRPLGVRVLGKDALFPAAALCFLLSFGILVLRKKHPFTFFLYPLFAAIFLTVNFILEMAFFDDPSPWPEAAFRWLMATSGSLRMAALKTMLVLVLEIVLLALAGMLVSAGNAAWRKKQAFKAKLKEREAAQQRAEQPAAAEEAPEEEDRRAGKEAAKARKAELKRQRKEAKRQAKIAKRAAKRAKPDDEAEEGKETKATVEVPLQQDDGHLHFPEIVDVPQLDHLITPEEGKETQEARPAQPAPQPKAEGPRRHWDTPQSSPTMLDLIKEKVQQETAPAPSGKSAAPASVPEQKPQISGLLQGAMERMRRQKTAKAAPVEPKRGQGKGLLVEAVEENLRTHKDIADMGSSFSKVVPDSEAEVMKPVEQQEAAYQKKPEETKPREQTASVRAAYAPPVEPVAAPLRKDPEPRAAQPKPTPVAQPKPAPVVQPKPAPVEQSKPAPAGAEKDDDALDDLQSICGVGGLASANAGKSALLGRKPFVYEAPPVDILLDYPEASREVDELTKQKGDRLVETLDEFGVSVTPLSIIKGPTVTLYEIMPAPGVKVGKIIGLADNIQLALPATQVRIIAPIPGKRAVGIEVPNANRATVGFKEMLPALQAKDYKVPMILGRNLLGEPVCIDVAKTPHLLIAGATGSGKSVCVNSLICSILYTKSPREVRMVMVDPKVVELQMYNGIPHLLTPVITESKKALKILDFCLDEMDRRYKLLEGLKARNIVGYNEKVAQGGICREKLPYIVVIIDEFADLMNTVGKELEQKVSRLTAMSRAVGIHLVLATQRPSVDVVTGIIKANIPGRIAFMVNNATDSRIILDQSGAEKLLGRGDMLYLNPADPNPQRIQGAFLSDGECEKIVDFVSKEAEPDYIDEAFLEDEPDKSDGDYDGGGDMDGLDDGDDDEVYRKALDIVVERKCASASFLQRRLRIGYNRAARIVEQMEEEGIVGPANGSKPRPLLRYPDSPSLQQLDAGEAAQPDDIG